VAEKSLTIDFWDVGQGDGTVVRLPDGRLILIDIGPKNSPIIDWLADTPRHIHAAVISHNDSDHAGALPSLVKMPTLSFSTVYMLLDRDKTSVTFRRLWQPVRDEERKKRFSVLSLTADSVIWQDGPLSLRVIYPSFSQNIDAVGPNETCGIVCLYYKNELEIIWAADVPMRVLAEKCMGSTPYLLGGPHHGGPVDRKDPQFRQRVEAFCPDRVFISVGTTNQHGHPSSKYLNLHVRRGCHLICTQLTKLCDNIHVNQETPVLQSAALLGLRPARSGVPCRGCLRLTVYNDGSIAPDRFDDEHMKRVKALKRPHCII
jgi:competence protein ComEC